MKYYILDLSHHNSLVNWLVGQGHTVFMISWKNPTEEDSGLGMDEYYRLGAMAAIDKVSKAAPETKIHRLLSRRDAGADHGGGDGAGRR